MLLMTWSWDAYACHDFDSPLEECIPIFISQHSSKDPHFLPSPSVFHTQCGRLAAGEWNEQATYFLTRMRIVLVLALSALLQQQHVALCWIS